MKKLLLFFFVVLALPLFSQNNAAGWKTNFGESQKRFIENKSQFDGKDKLPDSKILYGIDQNGTQIFFTKQGLSYRFDVRQNKDKEKSEKEEVSRNKMTAEAWAAHEKEERSMKIETDVVHMQWENSNPDVQVIAEEVAPDYFSYTIGKENINYIKGYKKLIYKNLYPGIDVEYIFPGGKEGVKYSLILHPGADVSKVKMNYSNARKIFSDDSGNIHITTLFGDIIDHAPVSYYENHESVSSKFQLTGNSAAFKINPTSNTQHLTSIIIDPWTQTPTLPNSNGVWECEVDGAGNVYIIGGCMPMKLLKYTSAGAPVWTYTTPWDTANNWLGTLATDLAGNSYVTSGSIAEMQKVSPAGAMVWNSPAPLFSSDEYWTISFNCDQTMLVVGGTTGAFINLEGAIFNINTANGSVIGSPQIVGAMFNTIPPYINEVRTLTASKNARYYYLTLDTIGCIDQNFACTSNPIFEVSSGYKLSYKCENFRPNNGNGGIKSIRANGNFVYTQNGTNVQKRSLATGAVITTVAIPGGVSTGSLGRNVVGNSGLDIDSCGNVYVGSANQVVKYDANLNMLSSTPTTYVVSDVAVSYGGTVISCGTTGTSASTSRTGYVQSASMANCEPMTLVCCNTNICNAGPFCDTDPPQTLSSSQSGGTWSGTGITNASTGVFSPAVSGTGTFTITYALSCGNGTMQIVVKSCLAPSVCLESNGDLTAQGGSGPNYVWQVQGTANDCSACFVPALCQPPAPNCPQIITTWSTYSTSTTATPPGTFPIRVQDASGNTYTITSTAGLPSCSATLNVTSTHVNPNCFGQCTGTATVTASSGTSPYTYAWSPSGGNSSAATGLCAGAYTVLVTDAASTTKTTTITISQPVALTATASVTSASCGSGGTATVAAAGGTPTYTYAWAPSGGNAATASGLTGGTYTATVTDSKGCSSTTTVSINTASGGTVSVNAQTILCNGNNSTVAASMSGGTSPFTYVWSGGQSTSSITVPAGNYSVTVTDANGCTSAQSVSVTQPAALTTSVSATGTNCGATTGTAAVAAAGGTGTLTYLWTPGGQNTSGISNLGAGTYSCTITDANGCSSVLSAVVNNLNGPNASITAQTNNNCFGESNGTAAAAAAGGTSPYTYLWNTTPPQASANATGLAAGTYTVVVTDATGCTNTQTVTITQPPAISPTVTATTITVTPGGSSTLTASGGISYVWNNGAGSTATVTVSPNVTTHYCVIASDANGCSDSACVTVYVIEPCVNTYYLPNAFSPNNDADNDYLQVFFQDVSCIKEYKLGVYDRWGEKVFYSEVASTKWDGVYKGKMMDPQVLAYYLHIIFNDGTAVDKEGNISLMK